VLSAHIQCSRTVLTYCAHVCSVLTVLTYSAQVLWVYMCGAGGRVRVCMFIVMAASCHVLKVREVLLLTRFSRNNKSSLA
jgi:uncharacterized protein with PQ loop repeat